MQEVYDKVKKFDLFRVSETHLLPKNGKQLDLYQDLHGKRGDFNLYKEQYS